MATPSAGDPEEHSVSDKEGDGTFHQSKLGPKPKRRHFFSPLDPTYAQALQSDAESVVYSDDEEVCFWLSHFEFRQIIDSRPEESAQEDR